ncbi:MAG: MFS transporter [Actinomycetota bacterium]|nr:MFS transporter [Actinomycetota bacterium]
MTSPVRRALAAPRFRRLFLAQTVSRWGDTFNAVALVILVFELTGSGVNVALTVAFEVVPVLLFGFLAGSVVDRLPRQRVMILADVGRAAIALALVVGQNELVVVYAAAFGLSALSVFFNPAAASILPALVDEEDLVGANSAVWSAAVVSQIALAPAAGALVAFAGAGPAFALNAATFVVSALLLTGLRVLRRVRPVAGKHLEDVRAGFAVVRSSRLLATLASVQALAALSAGATSALLVVLAQDHLGVGATRFGWLLAAISVGAGFGPLLLQRLIADPKRPTLLFGPYLLRGLVDLVLAAVASFAVALGSLVVYGVATSTGTVTYNSVLQTVVPDRFRGRIFAFYDVRALARLALVDAGQHGLAHAG